MLSYEALHRVLAFPVVEMFSISAAAHVSSLPWLVSFVYCLLLTAVLNIYIYIYVQSLARGYL